MDAVFADLAAHWPIYASIPFVAALIGYLTKRAAIEMMFRPLEFAGLEPYLGWQGVVPRHGARMASVATDLFIANLLDPRELLARIDADRIIDEVEQPLLGAIDAITREVIDEHYPGAWGALPPLARELIIKRVQAAAPEIVRCLVAELADRWDELIDVRGMAVRHLTCDKALLVKLIREISRPEMTFIARSGSYFGFALGLVQIAAWAWTKHPMVLPMFGALIGLVTDWMAIKLVFFPRDPMRIGPVRVQGKFQRRRHEVARHYGELIAHEVLTVENLIDAMLGGRRLDLLADMVMRTVAAEFAPTHAPAMTHAAAARAVQAIPNTIRHARGYLTEAMDVANLVEERMSRMTPVQYEGLLRPAFRQDEWKLITVGAIIGGVVGELQVLLLLH